MNIASIRRKLTRWYERVKRDLPWRHTRDPYAIWVSEIMLQQTRVAAVIPYYQRFLARFPNAAALADAPQGELLALWSGLGYYSRARNMQKAAREIAAQGEFPQRYEDILELAGIGEYTAAAIASIAFGLPHAAVDGNVRRVVARLANDSRADSRAIAARLLDRRDPGRWNQAMMELGATMCVPRVPLCESCPLAQDCGAHRAGTADQIPAKRKKPETVQLELTLLVIRRHGKLLLTPSTYVRGFWDLPGAEMVPASKSGPALGSFSHAITNKRYRFTIQEGTLRRTRSGRIAGLDVPRGLNAGRPVLRPSEFRWFEESKLAKIPLSTIARKALRIVQNSR